MFVPNLGNDETEGCGSMSDEMIPHPTPKEDGSKKSNTIY
jgi:hypothetical protein